MTRLRYNGLRGVLGGALTSSGTTLTLTAPLTHANGVAVPTVTSPAYLPVTVLSAVGRLAEIVWITAYTTGSTTATIARGKESTTGIAHATGAQIVRAGTADDEDANPLGTILMWMGNASTPPPGYLVLAGGTFSSATYPLLATHLGTTTLPDMRGRLPLGSDDITCGDTGGYSTIDPTHLPPHSHTINHDHGSALTGVTSHNHGVQIQHNTNTVANASGSATRVSDVGGVTGAGGVTATAGTGYTDHSHSFDMPNFVGGSGNGPGTNATFLPPHLTVHFIIKAR